VPSQLLGHRPWIVQEVEGPVTGFVSQNCTCWNRPPGELRQHVSLDEPPHDRSSEVSGQLLCCARAKGRAAVRAQAILEKECIV
jgi:hypothetical protein